MDSALRLSKDNVWDAVIRYEDLCKHRLQVGPTNPSWRCVSLPCTVPFLFFCLCDDGTWNAP